MKKTIAALLLLVGSCAFLSAQGTFTFNNNTATRITNALTSVGAVGVNVGAYYSANTNAVTTQDSGSMLFAVGTRTNTIANGTFIGGTRNIPGLVGGTPIAMQVRAWSGAFATYEDAVASGDPSVLLGQSLVFHMPTLGGGPGNIPTPAIFGANKLNQFNVNSTIPEPSSIALGLLGLGAIALFRRRK